MFLLLVTLVASQSIPNAYNGLVDSCGQAVDSSDTNSKFISFVGTASELTQKCSYMALDQVNANPPAGTESWYLPDPGWMTWPIYERKDPAVRYVFDCSQSQYTAICNEGLQTDNSNVYYPQNCRYQSGDFTTCSQRTQVPKPNTWPYDWQNDKIWANYGGSSSIPASTLALLTMKDGVTESNVFDYAEFRDNEGEDNWKWWAWMHELSFQHDPTLFDKVAAFMNPHDEGFFCITCQTHFTYELAPDLPYTDLQKQNMVLTMWDLHNRANWEIKASKPDDYDWDMYPSMQECDTCRGSSSQLASGEANWNYPQVQMRLYEMYFPGAALSNCVTSDSESSCAANGCFWNSGWGACQEEPSCNDNVSMFGWTCNSGETFSLVRDALGCIQSYTCEGAGGCKTIGIPNGWCLPGEDDAGMVCNNDGQADEMTCFTDSSGDFLCGTSECQNASTDDTCTSGDVKLVAGTAYVWDDAAQVMSPICGHWFTDDDAGSNIVCEALGYASGSAERGVNVVSPYGVGNCYGERGNSFPDCGTPSGPLTCGATDVSVVITCVDSNGAADSSITQASCVEPVTTAEPTVVSTDAYQYIDAGFATADDASTACNGAGMSLCSSEQLFRVVFSEVDGFAGVSSVPTLCRSGWMSTDYNGDSTGFWHAAADGSCGSADAGWHGWAPDAPAAHCCADFTGSTVQTCGADYNGCGDGFLVNAQGWCGDLTGCDNDACCTPWTAAPLYAVVPSQYENIYFSADEADQACQDYHEDMRLCTQDQLEGLAKDYGDSLSTLNFDNYYGADMCSLGWYITAAGEAESSTVGFYVDDDFTAYSNDYGCGSSAGFTAWIPTDAATGQNVGSAHCCVPSYVKSGYSALSEISLSGAEDYCASLPYPKQVCTKYQLRRIVEQEDPSPCMAGYMKETSDDTTGVSGWWQGDAGDIGGCGNDYSWNVEGGWAATYRGAHCCESYVLQATTPAYYHGSWADLYSSASDAEAQCGSGYSLCSEAQIEKVATDGVVLDDGETVQLEPAICRFGWTAEGTIGWYQGDASQGCGASVGWHGTDSGSHTYHCCTDFEGVVKAVTSEPTAGPPGPCEYGDVKIVDSTAYVYKDDDTGFQPICSHYFANGYLWGGHEVCKRLGYSEATLTTASGVVADETAFFVGDCWNVDTFPQCTNPDGWTECAGALAMTTLIECDGQTVPDNTASCILPDTTEPPVTEQPTTTTAAPTTTTAAPSDATGEPTAAAPVDVGDLPSSVAPPSNCQSIAFVPAGFEGHVSYCVSDGVVYLNGRNTCIPETTDNLDTALQNSWENDWYLAPSPDCSGKDYDAATDDQLWITNEMCNNLDDNIDELETAVDGLNTYMDEWTQDIIDLVNGQIGNFDQATQDALNQYLETLT